MQAFEQAYVAAFTRTPPTTQVEIINVRVSASLDVEGAALPRHARASAAASPLKGTRPVFFPEFRDFRPHRRLRPLRARTRRRLRRPGHRRGARVRPSSIGPGGRFREVRASGSLIVTHRAEGDRAWPSIRRPAANHPFDAVTLEILWRRTISAVDEAAKALRRTSFSTLVNESNDFACVLTDATGQSLAQNTESIPSFIGTLPVTVKEFIKQIGLANMAPGDVLVTNTPWIATGHLNDITVAKPIFRHGRIVAFAASTAHAPDIGGKVRSVEPREVFEEGFHIPVMKFMNEGKPDQTFLKLLRAAVRTPDQTEGDLWAQITGLDLLERRLGDLMAEYGLDDLDVFAGEILGRCETAMRSAIRALPDGTYMHEFQTDGLEQPFTYRIAAHRRRRPHQRRLRRHQPPGRSRHQLHDDLHLCHDGLCAQMRAAARAPQQRGHLPLHRGVGASGLHRQPALPRCRRRSHGDGPLPALRRVRRARIHHP